MKAGYKTENHSVSRFSTEILVMNLHSVNEIINLPIINREVHGNKYTVGFWKIKQLKQNNKP